MTFPKLKVHLAPNGRGSVEIDGVAVKWVERLSLNATRDGTRVVLHLCPFVEVELTADEAHVLASLPKLGADAPVADEKV